MPEFKLSILELVLLSSVLLFMIVQLLYYMITYMRPLRKMKQSLSKGCDYSMEQPPVSIIVYAKNESNNLEKHLPSILNQDYPQYEVIVINDGSTDESDNLLLSMEREYPNLYHTFIPQESKYLSRRKLSITLGVKAAKYEILFFIEANCYPLSNKWLASMVRNYNDNTMILLGYCTYKTNKGFLHKLIGYDNLVYGTQYLSSALKNHPYSGSGRNLSYRKKIFFEHKGFSNSLNLHAGDDDLFVNETATQTNTRTEYYPESLTEMSMVESFGIWREMKVSRASTRKHYRGWQPFLYHLEAACSICFILSFMASLVVGILLSNYYVIAISVLLFTVLYTVKATILNRLAVMLQQKKFTLLTPILEFARITMNIYVLIYRTFRGKHDYTFTIGTKSYL